MTLDIRRLASSKSAEEGFELELLDDRRMPTGAFIRIRGADGDTYRAKRREIQRSRLAGAQGRDLRTLPDRVDEEELELLAGVTTGWRGLLSDGVELAYSEAAAMALYRDVPGIKEQVDAAVHNRANFLPPFGTS